MPYLRLQPFASFGMVGERPVFLDIRRDRYLSLDPAALPAFESLRAGAPLAAEEAERLLATGLFAVADQPCPVSPAETEAPDACLDSLDRSPGSSILDLPAVWRLTKRVRRELKATPLEHVLHVRRSRTSEDVDMAKINRATSLALRFRNARAIVPGATRCLPDSLALHDWLSAHGVASILVLAVKLDPFAAHCWIQYGPVALNEAPDRAVEFTPVLVLQ